MFYGKHLIKNTLVPKKIIKFTKNSHFFLRFFTFVQLFSNRLNAKWCVLKWKIFLRLNRRETEFLPSYVICSNAHTLLRTLALSVKHFFLSTDDVEEKVCSVSFPLSLSALAIRSLYQVGWLIGCLVLLSYFSPTKSCKFVRRFSVKIRMKRKHS